MIPGPHAEIMSPYFQHMRALLPEILGDIDVKKLSLVTAKNLYKGFTSTFPPPKVTYKYDVEWEQVWSRLMNPVLDIMGREILFMIIHNIVANKDRVFKFNMIASPNCSTCGVAQDNVHLFCECLNVREAWFWVRQRVLDLLPQDGAQTSNFELIHLMFPSSHLDSEIVWLLGIYVQQVWTNIISKKKFLTQFVIKNECFLQYINHQASSRPQLAHIIDLS